MNLTDEIVAFFKHPEKERKGKSPKGLCSICWGYQEYDGKIQEIFKDKQIDVNNHKESYTLIQDFVHKYLDGIKLKDGEIHSCPTCSSRNEDEG